jgi:hypothetical protein
LNGCWNLTRHAFIVAPATCRLLQRPALSLSKLHLAFAAGRASTHSIVARIVGRSGRGRLPRSRNLCYKPEHA